MDSSDLEGGAKFTTDGKDIWILRSHYLGPSCDLENLETGEKQNFGMGGFTAQSFHRIEMPVIPDKSRTALDGV